MKLEQPKQENKENTLENKRVNFELDVEGIKIPCWKENVSYPKNIQKETQIEGYEKIRITWENLFNFIQKDLDILENIDEQDYRKKFYKLLKIANEKSLEKETIGNQDKLGKQLLDKLLSSFSNGEFPKKTYNHSLYGDHEYPVLNIGHYEIDTHKEFFNQDTLLGKINNVNEKSPTYLDTQMVILDKDNHVEFWGQLIKAYDHTMRVIKNYTKNKENNSYTGTLCREEEFPEVFKNKIFLDSKNGLNILPGKLWSTLDRPNFGFDVKEPPFSEYLKKINFLYQNISSEFIDKHNKDCVSFMVSNDDSEKFYEEIRGHPYLPIMTGNTGLPELRWGHCKYASIPTKDSLNLITLKHIEKTN